MKNKPLHNELVNATKSNRLIVFSGAGISFNLRNVQGKAIGGWSNMIETILSELKDVPLEIKLNDKNYSPIERLKEIESLNIPQENIYKKIRQFYRIDPQSDLSVHRKIVELTDKIITTNYDNGFELVSPHSNIYSLGNELNSISKFEKPYVFKIHGSCNKNDDPLILFPEDYDNLYLRQSNLSVQAMLKFHELILNNTILFVGSGMGDFQINSIFRGFHGILRSRKKQFIFSKRKFLGMDAFWLRFLTPIIIQDYSDIPQILDELLRLKKRKVKNRVDKSNKNEEAVQLMLMGNRMLQKDRFREALKYFEKAITTLPSIHPMATYKLEAPLLNNLGIAKYEIGIRNNDTGLIKDSVDCYQKSLKIFHEDDFVHQNLGNAYLDLAKIESKMEFYKLAFSHFGYATKINMRFDNAYFRWGEGLFYYRIDFEDFSKLKEEISKFIESTKLNKENFERVMELYIKNEDVNNCLLFLEECLRLNIVSSFLCKESRSCQRLIFTEKYGELISKYE